MDPLLQAFLNFQHEYWIYKNKIINIIILLENLVSSDRYRKYTMLDSALFDLSNISHVINIGQDLIFVASDKIKQTNDFFPGKAQQSCCVLNLE